MVSVYFYDVFIIKSGHREHLYLRFKELFHNGLLSCRVIFKYVVLVHPK